MLGHGIACVVLTLVAGQQPTPSKRTGQNKLASETRIKRVTSVHKKGNSFNFYQFQLKRNSEIRDQVNILGLGGGGGGWMLTFDFLESVEKLAIDSELEKMLGFEQAAIQTVQTIL